MKDNTGMLATLVPILLLMISACNTTAEELFPLEVGNKILQVELASSPEARQIGLMNREHLPYDQGMLFVFEKDDTYGFWMKNTLIPLSIAFIDSRGCIREIHDMRPLSLRVTAPEVPVRYALEVNQGYFTDSGVTAGMCLDLPD